jgi:hypothetical protein
MYWGRGAMLYNNGSMYEGYWKNGRYDGSGRLIWYNGSVYRGVWTNGEREIFEPEGLVNTFIYENGDKYKGFLVRDKKDGFGVMNYANGETFVG